MAKRFCDTEIWDKDWFMNLSCKHKCLIRFIFDKCDVAGIWEPNWTLASIYVGVKCTESDLSVFSDQFMRLPNGKIFVLDFISFQYGTLSEKSNPHVKVISILKKQNLYEGYLRGTLKGTSGDMDKEEDKDKDMVKDMDKVKEKEAVPKLSIQMPFGDDFNFSWELWKTYKKQQHNFTYKSVLTEQAALNDLVKLANGSEQTANEIIKQSISKGWQGLFGIKNQNNNNGKSLSKVEQRRQDRASS